MRIALVNTVSAFVRGGAELLVDDLADQLRLHGHDVNTLRIPFPQTFDAKLLATLEASRLMCFNEFDRVIAFKFPAYCIKHHAKVIWLFHQFRQVYDLWATEFGLHPDNHGNSMRTLITAADNQDIPLSRKVYTNAVETSNRLKQYNNIDSEVLMPPLKNSELYYGSKTGNYLFFQARITPLKRQHLAVEAMKYVKSGVELIIAGRSESEHYLKNLKSIIHENRLEKRVKIINDWISDETKREMMADSLACIYIPYQEDSCGFTSMEALYSGKPVITCVDSGGTGEIIEDGKNGYIVQSNPESLASAMDKLFENKQIAENMGIDGRNHITKMDITWPSTIRRLLI